MRNLLLTLKGLVLSMPIVLHFAATAQAPFITTWTTETDGESITIPTTGDGYAYTVNWGDGQVDGTIYTGDATHVYAAAGDYTVSISGDFPRIYFDKTGADNSKIKSIKAWGDMDWSSMAGAFSGCIHLVLNATDAPDLSAVTDLSYMFSETTFSRGDFSNWDVSGITNMSGMFFRAISFNGDLSKWDMSGVTNMSWMFSEAHSFNGDLGSWHVSAVTDMSYLFSEARSFNGDLSSWDVSKVTNMMCLFRSASAFDGNIENWDVSAVTNMNGMFSGARAFSGNLGEWDVSQVTNMRNMFANARSFNGNVSTWNVSSVITMSGMFYEARSFNRDLNNWNVSKVTDMRKLFSGTDVFNGDISSWDVSSVTDMSGMFSGALVFKGDLSGWDVSAVTDMSRMFNGAASFDGDLNGWDVSQVTDMTSMFALASLFNGDVSDWDVSAVSSMKSMFAISGFGGDLSGWDVSAVTDMGSMFHSAAAFNSDLSNWNVSKVTDMSDMFGKASSFESDLSTWDVSSVTDMSWMFYEASSFQSDLGDWDVSNVTTMKGMFASASSFDSDLARWDISEVRYMAEMFSDSHLSLLNYENTLRGWATLEAGETRIPEYIDLGADGLTYCEETFRKKLTGTYHWDISGDASGGCVPTPDKATLDNVISECPVTPETPTASDSEGNQLTGTADTSFPVTTQGITTVIWTYTDADGNTTTQTQMVMIIGDNTAPVADSPALPDITAECEVRTLNAPAATDNCGEVTITHDATLPITTQSTTTVTWTYTDAAGNFTTQEQKVVITDRTPPVANVSTLPDVIADCGVHTLQAPAATDHCSEVTTTHDATLPITTQGTTIVTWTYTDAAGNFTTQEQKIQVNPCFVTGLEEHPDQVVTIHPNPVQNFFQISTSNAVNVERMAVYSLNGQVVHCSKKKNDGYDIGNFAKGTYVVKVYLDNGAVVTQKLVKD